jgi:hypothetical protein
MIPTPSADVSNLVTCHVRRLGRIANSVPILFIGRTLKFRQIVLEKSRWTGKEVYGRPSDGLQPGRFSSRIYLISLDLVAHPPHRDVC